jgi:hypothetical protein
MRIRSMRFLLMAMLLVPTYGRAQGNTCGDLHCGDIGGGSVVFGTLHLWCVVVHAFLCPLQA